MFVFFQQPWWECQQAEGFEGGLGGVVRTRGGLVGRLGALAQGLEGDT